MEVEESQTHQGGKHPRKGDEQQYPDEEEDGDVKRRSNGGGDGGGFDFNRLCGWPSSRIVRVSRASGGKDRHSKVLTSKGLRDRRVRLSVNTAIQFYDLQDRLGFDQPSKAVEWLLQAAARSIAELPSINTPYPDITITTQQQQHHRQQQQLGDERRSPGAAEHGFASAGVEIAGSFDPNYQLQGQHHQQHRHQNGALSKSNSCSTSETSKGSGLSLSGSESRIKRRERARERVAEKQSETPTRVVDQFRQNLKPISQNASSFTELLTNGMNTINMGGNSSNTNGLVHQNHSGGGGGGAGASEANFLYKSPRQWSSTPMDYFASELLGPASTRAGHGFPGQIHFGEHYQEMQPFAFVSDNFVPLVNVAAGNNNNNNNNNNNEHDLNFTISSASSSSPSLAGFNRGTLQSNSSMPQLQRFSSADGSPSAFFIGTAQPHNAPVENHHHHHHHHHSLTGFDARLQLFYGDGRHSDYKGKGKS